MGKAKDVSVKATQAMGSPITWAQVSLAAMERLADLTRRAPKAAQLVQLLVAKMQAGGGGVVVASRTTLAELMGTSLPTTERALALLMREGWVQRIRIGAVPALAINARVAWVGPRGQIDHAVFQATVIASRTEQDAMALDPPSMAQVPVVNADELALPEGAGLPPPSQPSLPGLEPVMYRDAEGRFYEIDRETGEVQQTFASLPSASTAARGKRNTKRKRDPGHRVNTKGR